MPCLYSLFNLELREKPTRVGSMSESQIAQVVLRVLASEQRAKDSEEKAAAAELRALAAEERERVALQRADAAELEMRQDEITFDRINLVIREIEVVVSQPSPLSPKDIIIHFVQQVRENIRLTRLFRYQ